MEFQTRNDAGELKFFETFDAALGESAADNTVWKISFSLPTKERIRLVKIRRGGQPIWVYDPILSE